jgi:uncharacterized circularly permuted ATP-grasp superfamily protein
MKFDVYETDQFYDELMAGPGEPRECARLLIERINQLSSGDIDRHQQAAEQALLQMGITFNVYGAEGGTERIFPFDIIPRIIPGQEWRSPQPVH